MDFHVGQTFNDYAITGVLGAGGMGRVYKVEHRLTKRTEAMKVLSAEFASEIQIKRFEREMRVLARLSHPNIAVLHNALHSEKQLVLFMEFIEGRTLENMLNGGRIPMATGIGFIQQILFALQYAHQQGVVHRDVTPANVIVSTAGDVKLTDFGLSKSFGDAPLTTLGEILGAMPYLGPEQIKGTSGPDQRSDLYSVGVILYELLTGRKPFGSNRRISAVLADSEGEPQPPSQIEPAIPPGWDGVTHRALQRDPADRYQSAEEFLGAIAGIGNVDASERSGRQRAFAFGGAALVGLAIALAAAPALEVSSPAAPPIWLSPARHIAPPDFALAPVEPPAAQPAPAKAAPLDIRVTKRAKPVVPPGDGIVKEPETAADTSVPELIVPVPELPAPAQELSAPAQKLSAPAPGADEQPDKDLSQPKPPKTKRFWSRFNLFRIFRSRDSNARAEAR